MPFSYPELFESKGAETLLDWSLLFDSAEMREIVVKAHEAEKGQKQNLEKLEKYLSRLLIEPKAK